MNRPSSVLFLADAHLRGPNDPNQRAFLRFLDQRQPEPGGLVILGDLFEFLAGNNRMAATQYRPVLERLGRFAPFHFLEGNHDFDLSQTTPGLEGAAIHPGPVSLELFGMNCRLLHGDRSAPFDFGTRWLRWMLQSNPIRFARDRLLPDPLVFGFAMAFASFSRRHIWPGRSRENLVLRQMASREIRENGMDLAIFAHTHEALLLKVPNGAIANPGPAVPGGSYLELTPQTLSLRRFPDGVILPAGTLELVNQPRRVPGQSSPPTRSD